MEDDPKYDIKIDLPDPNRKDRSVFSIHVLEAGKLGDCSTKKDIEAYAQRFNLDDEQVAWLRVAMTLPFFKETLPKIFRDDILTFKDRPTDED